MSKKLIYVLGTIVLAAVIIGAGYFVVSNSTLAIAQATGTGCPTDVKADMRANVSVSLARTATKATATVKSTSTNCTYDMGIASYKMYDSSLETQTTLDSELFTLKPGETKIVSVDIPACAYQVDVFQGGVMNPPYYHLRPFARGFQYMTGGYCVKTPPAPTTATIKVVKTVVNDNGGTKQVSDFELYVGSTRVTSGVSTTVNPGTYTVREVNLTGYTAGTWGGDCHSNGTIILTAGQNKTCTITNNDNAPASIPTLGGYCVPSASTVNVNDTVTWTAHPTGGTGSYTYSWSGWDTLSGNSKSVTESYTYAGTKPSTVVITSGDKTFTANCTTTVVQPQQPQNPALSGECIPSKSSEYTGETVTWTANASGGNGSYTYSWTGWDDLSGTSRTVTKSYTYTGTKTATVVITSDGHSISKTCTMVIVERPTPSTPSNPSSGGGSNFNARCEPEDSEVYVGDEVTWISRASSTRGDIDYSWKGTDGLSGDEKNITHTYKTAGKKSATVTIKNRGRTDKDTCTVTVKEKTGSVTPEPTQAGGVYLSQVPYTGIDSNMKVALFVLGLIIWSSVLSYFLIQRKAKQQGLTFGEFINKGGVSMMAPTAFQASAPVESPVTVIHPQPVVQEMVEQAPVVAVNEITAPTGDFMTDLETKARESRMVISSDGLSMIAVLTGRDTAEAHKVVESLAVMYRSDLSDATDWASLNADKVSKIVGR